MIETEVQLEIITRQMISPSQIMNILAEDIAILNCDIAEITPATESPSYRPAHDLIKCKGTIFSAQRPEVLEDDWLSIIANDLLKNTVFDVIQEIRLKVTSTGYDVSNNVGMLLWQNRN